MFSDSLKSHRKKANLSQQSLAKLVGVSQSTIAMWESGKNTPEYSSLITLAVIFNTSVDSLVGNQSLPQLKSIPVFKNSPIHFPCEKNNNILYYENTYLDTAEDENYFAVVINDDSMYPRMMIGDLAIASYGSDYTSGDICVLQIKNDITIKKIISNSYGIILSSLNPLYEPKFYSLENINYFPITIIGKVIELRAKL